MGLQRMGLQRMDDEEARGETQVYASQHASQPSKARTGGNARAVGLEQLSFLSSRRVRAGTGESGMAQDFVPGSGGVASQLQAFVGTHCVADAGKAWATRQR